MSTTALKVTGSTLIADVLNSYSVDHVFGVPGGHCLPLYQTLLAMSGDKGPRVISARHEQGAGFMAAGYALATRKPGVVLTTAGPGVTNVLTPVAQAYCESIPLVVLALNNYSSQLDRRLGLFHELEDFTGLFSGRCVDHFRVLDPSDLPYALGQAFNFHHSRRPGPYIIEIPSDILSRDAESVVWSPWRACLPIPEPTALDAAARLLVEAKRPVLLVGGGAKTSNAGPEASVIAEMLGAIIITTVNGRGVIADHHALSGGCLWDRIRSEDDLAREADLIFAIGTSLSSLATRGGLLPLPRALIQLDIDDSAFGRQYTPSLALIGDAKATLSLLATRLPIKASIADIRTATEHRVRQVRRKRISDLVRCAPTVAQFCDSIAKALPESATIVCDMTVPAYWIQRYLPINSTGQLLSTYAFGALGLGLPLALGAKAGLPDHPVVMFCGDGGFLFNSQELATARQFHLNIVVVLFNDNRWAAVQSDYRRLGGGQIEAFDLVNPDFAALAVSYGWDAVKINVSELGATLSRACRDNASRHCCTLLEVIVTDQLPMPNDVNWAAASVL